MDAAARQAALDLDAGAAALRRVADFWTEEALRIRATKQLDARSAEATADARHLLTAEQTLPPTEEG